MKCPACGSPRVFPSRPRSVLERFRQALTDKQPYRCHQCNWRKWDEVEVRADNMEVRPDDLRTGRVPDPLSPTEIDSLDTAS